MGTVITIKNPYSKFFKKWGHRLFNCPSYKKSLWNTIMGRKPFINCPGCGKPIHCYWDGNDISGYGTDYCNKCTKILESKND